MPSTNSHFDYFARYKADLVPLIGVDAATVVVSCYRWTLAGLMLVLVAFLGGAVVLGASSTVGGLVIAVSFALAICCAVRSVSLTSRGGKLASAYLTKEWGQPVNITGVKPSLRWWRWRLDLERERLQTGDD